MIFSVLGAMTLSWDASLCNALLPKQFDPNSLCAVYYQMLHVRGASSLLRKVLQGAAKRTLWRNDWHFVLTCLAVQKQHDK